MGTHRFQDEVQPQDADVWAAVEFLSEDYDHIERDVARLRFLGIRQMRPIDFVDDAAHLGRPRLQAGWLHEYPEDEWEKELKSEYSRPFDHILGYWRNNRMPPGIQINGEMGDGRGRACFHYALGIKKMPVAVYEVDVLEDGVLVREE